MEQKIKFIMIGLVAILAISIFITIQTLSSRQAIERERDALKKENASLMAKADESIQDNRRLQDKVSSLNRALEEIAKQKEDIQRKFELINKEREELIAKLKTQRPAVQEVKEVPATLTEEAHWAEVLQAKTDLELQLGNVRNELRDIQISNEKLQHEKSILELDVKNLTRDKEDLKKQMEYNQKIMDNLTQELVIEKNDKFQVKDNIRALKNENRILIRQLKSLNNRKINLEKKLIDLQQDKTELADRLTQTDTFLKGKAGQIERLKRDSEITAEELRGAPIRKEEVVELPPIVVRPPVEKPTLEKPASLEGKILAINKENNFVIIDLGEDSGVRVGDTFKVYRYDEVVAKLEVIQIRQTIAACDIKQQTAPLRVGDTLR